ncbi:MAG: hypothetical protein MJD61_12355 [Proteobacteria bacterium]|nr:hypothetical protein [Pseudomonadota bacterium]
MTEPLTYQNVVQRFQSAVPELSDHADAFYEDLPHDAFGTWTLALIKLLQHSSVDGNLLQKVADFLDAMAESPDKEVVNLLEVSVLEILADDEACIGRIEPRLGELARAHLDRVRQGGFPM